ncbi:hypothetical protein ADMFC3_02290 [Geovibrio sp. ADMFC3]
MKKILSLCIKENFPAAYELMKNSFHPAEIRSYEKALEILDNPEYSLYTAGEGKFDGILGVWNFEEFIFMEHLAVQPHTRGTGLGTSMMKEFLASCTKPAILEVEDEDSDIAKRRIGLYERLGFFLTDFGYIQPVMQKGETARIPLKIMSYKVKIDNGTLNQYKKVLAKKLSPTV